MLRKEEERFLSLAREIGVLDEKQSWIVANLVNETNRRPIPILLLEHEVLSDVEVDQVLGAMVGQHQETIRRGDALAEDGKFSRAITVYEAAIEANPSTEDGYWGRAEAFLQRGRLKDALSDFTRLVDLTVDRRGRACQRLGQVLLRLDRPVEALSQFERSVEEEPGSISALFDLGTCLQRLGRLQEAVDFYNVVLELAPEHIEALNNRAIAHLLLRNPAAAISDWQACLTIDSKRGTVRKNLKALLSRLRTVENRAD